MTTERSEEEQRIELEELREELGATVDELAQRADVPARVRARRDETLARGRELGAKAKTLVAEKASAVPPADRPPLFAAAGVVALLALLLLWRRRRR
jgi:MYXO-CTERM domain-containing protein